MAAMYRHRRRGHGPLLQQGREPGLPLQPCSTAANTADTLSTTASSGCA